MGAFATMGAAETRAKAGIASGIWINAHAGYTNMGSVICVRVQRFMSPANPSYGEWVEITDDATA